MNKKEKIILISIITIAILIRIIFVLNTTITEYQFDFGVMNLDSIEDYNYMFNNYDKEPLIARHISYILYLYNNNSLPEKIIGQFYHPPLHHFILTVWLKFMSVFTINNMIRLESMQFVSLIYSIGIIYFVSKILDELGVKNKIIPILLVSFYPLFIFLSGSLNNDELVTLFTLISILYLLRWEKNPSIKNTILGALAIGCGMMTKLSILVIFAPMAYVFFKKLFTNQEITGKTILKYILELIIVFLIVSVLGLWYQIYRNFNSLGIIEPIEELSVAKISLLERFGPTNIFKIMPYNVWNSLINTSINFMGTDNSILVIIMTALIVFLFIEWLYCFIKSSKNYLIIITSITYWLGYFYLNISMPYICSMHSRYMAVPLAIGFIDIGRGIEKVDNKVVKYAFYFIDIVFSIISICYMLSL